MVGNERGLLSNPEPPEPFFVEAGCGCEVYEGGNLVEDEKGRTKCEECFKDEIATLTLEELAERFNATVRVVTRKEILP